MTYTYAWGPRIKNWPAASPLKQLNRKGEACEVVCRGGMNSCLVQFSDGEQAVVSRNALRRRNGLSETKAKLAAGARLSPCPKGTSL